jgi:N-glycosylase/DNA lyase
VNAAVSSSSSPAEPKRRREGWSSILFRVRDYDLAATLDSGQSFRWHPCNDSWVGVIGRHWVRLTQRRDGLRAETAGPVADWQWLRDYLQTETDLDAVLKTFPDDAPMRDAVAACHGLRVLRQDPWECLASFILSSTKQIVQIRQITALLCERFGEPVSLSSPKGGEGRGEEADYFETQIPSPPPSPGFGATSQPSPRLGGAREKNGLCFAFPTPQRIARVTEAELRACKMGFRAPYLLAAARQIANGRFDLERLRHLPLAGARGELTALRGVGGKIADCVLLFAYGFDGAFPVDVWVERALRELYFPRRRVSAKRLQHFAATHFGPHAGYAQQYLFHYMRTKIK